tara:strand:- start:201 stop:1373 length:1173 start_codon:yes stop_codon:yes gene_type:complete
MSTLKVGGIRGVSASSDAITVADDGTCTANFTNRTNKNLIINGAMNVAQRGSASNANNGPQTADRFGKGTNTTDETPVQERVDVASGTTPYTLGFRKAYKITNGNQTSGAQATTRVTIEYKIEAQDLANSGWNYLSSTSYITFSYWVKSSVAQNFYNTFGTDDGTSQRYVTETGSLSADTWTKITKTIPGNSNLTFNNDNGEGLEITWECFRGTNQTGTRPLNAWAAADNNTRTPDQTSTWYTTDDATFEITGVQLEVGSVATDFEHRSFAQELALCQRYYLRLGDKALVYYTIGNIDGGNEAQTFINFPTEMRVAPTSLETSGTASDYFLRVNSNQTCTSVPALSGDNKTTRSCEVIFRSNSHGFTTGHCCFGRAANTTDSFLGFNAEL